MEVLNKCCFCKRTAPKPRKSKGVWRMICSCGAQIEHPNYDSVLDLWNYTPNIAMHNQ